MGVAIQAEGLSMTYTSGGGGAVEVFSGASFRIEPGERVAVIGESGAGKSTLLHLLGGLDRPTAGRVYYGGDDIFAQSPDWLARFRGREIGFVWQQRSLLPEFTAEENVMMPLLAAGGDPDRALPAASEALRMVGLGHRARHRAGEMSGGEQQRVALARALVAKPRALLADEPTGSLDHRTGESVAALLAELHAELGFTAVVVTHNLGFARSFDRCLQLEKGDFRVSNHV